mmetsp:Transcript_103006/g.322304  ORF Transcript_103006/g.322304 Transcript_103006/m.322304 type:complete len:234 (+) Transcript_103006:3-704(+)
MQAGMHSCARAHPHSELAVVVELRLDVVEPDKVFAVGLHEAEVEIPLSSFPPRKHVVHQLVAGLALVVLLEEALQVGSVAARQVFCLQAVARHLLALGVEPPAEGFRQLREHVCLVLALLGGATERLLADLLHAAAELLLAEGVAGAADREADVVAVATLVKAKRLLDLHALWAAAVCRHLVVVIHLWRRLLPTFAHPGVLLAAALLHGPEHVQEPAHAALVLLHVLLELTHH